MRNDLIPFRAEVTSKSKYGVNLPINFPDGSRGMIRSIIEVECQSTGRVFVIGKYRQLNDKARLVK